MINFIESAFYSHPSFRKNMKRANDFKKPYKRRSLICVRPTSAWKSISKESKNLKQNHLILRNFSSQLIRKMIHWRTIFCEFMIATSLSSLLSTDSAKSPSKSKMRWFELLLICSDNLRFTAYETVCVFLVHVVNYNLGFDNRLHLFPSLFCFQQFGKVEWLPGGTKF